MRIFWIGIIILIAATAAVFLIPTGSPPEQADVIDTAAPAPLESPAPQAAPAETMPPTQANPVHTRPTPSEPVKAEAIATETNPVSPIRPTEQPGFEPIPEPRTKPSPDRAPEPNPPSNMPYPDEGPESGGGGPGVPVTHDSPATDPPDKPEPLALSPDPTPADAAETVAEETVTQEIVSEKPVAEPEVTAQPDPASTEILEAEVSTETAPIPAAEPITQPPAQPDPVVETPEGILLDGRWTIPGKGTADSPYVIQWDMLIAVKREYEPRLGKDKIPEWIAALNGKQVSIEGYTLLPIGVGTMSELLIMLNQWDGCCIGVPPSPFDAVEVRLKDRLTNNAGQMFAQGGSVAYGRITGTFEIDPYVAQGWLLGLYLINDARADLFGPAGAP